MNQYPLSLIKFLQSKKVQIGKFEELLDEFYDDMDYHDTALHNMELFFAFYFKSGAPDAKEMFEILTESKKHNYRRPKFMLPVKMLLDIRMQKTVDTMLGTPTEWKDVFGMPRIRKGQIDLLKGLYQSKSINKIVSASTGLGKTLVMLAYAQGKRTVIVEPDRGLQLQLKNKYHATTLMGRNNYKCRDHNVGADVTPCRFKPESEKSCSAGCKWHDAYHAAVAALNSKKPVVTNSWNMWQFFKDIDLVIFDEFHKILNELTVRYEIPDNVNDDTGLSYLQSKHQELADQKDALWNYLRENPEDYEKAKEYNVLTNDLQSLELFISSYEGSYIYEDNGRKYLKLDKISTMSHLANHFDFEKVFVSATPVHIPDADLIVTDDSVSKQQNAPIVYYPIGKLTSRALKDDPFQLQIAANAINMLYEHFREHGITKKLIIHTGNTTTHMEIANYLEMKTLKHIRGGLKETMERFNEGDSEALLIASADAGYDFFGSDFGLQFILKVPYPTRNNEWGAIRGKFGQVYEQNLYSQETISQIVQASGRICRGSEDMGMTVILDSKFADLFNRNREKFPEDFVDRLVDLSGELKHAVSREKIDYYQKVEK